MGQDRDDERARAHDDGGDKLPIGARLGEFEITGLVGEGGFSIVYLAWDHSLERKVALKEYMPSALASRSGRSHVKARSERHRETFEIGLKSFVNEGKLLAQFDHPALVKVYRFWEANGTAYMVMPLYEGVTLKDAVRALPQPPDERWLTALLDPLTEALAVIHRQQCFHRDIAPDNVMLLAHGGKPLLLDFGAARRVIGDKTQALTVILKPGYAPFEQYAEDPSMKQGPWTDVYALAAVVYWCITGKTPPVAVGRMLNDAYVPLVQCAAGRYGNGFLAAVDHALAVLPDKRTPSIAQFRAELGIVAKPGAHDDDDKTVVWSHPTADAPLQPQPKQPTTNETTRTLPSAPPQSAARTAPPVARTPAPAPAPAHAPVPAPAPKPAAASTATPPSRKPAVLAAGGIVSAALVAGIAWWSLRTPTPPATTASAPPPPVQSAPAPTPSPAPTPPPAAPTTATAPSPPPAPPPASPAANSIAERLLAQRDPSIELAASAQADAPGVPKAMLRIGYRASEPGYVYVVAVTPSANQLTLLHPAVGTLARRGGTSGSIDIAAKSLEAADTKLLLLLARERHEPQTAGWIARERTRTLRADVAAANIEQGLLGAPQCARRALSCDAAFGVTEVMQVTNVIAAPSPAPTPARAPDESTKTAPPTRDTNSAGTRNPSPSPEEKPPSRRSAADAAECARILQRVSLGESSAELIERMKTLRCG